MTFVAIWSAANLAILVLYRILFMILFGDPQMEANPGDLALQWLRGLRFDMATLPITLLPLLLLAPLLIRWHASPKFRAFLNWASFIQYNWIGFLNLILIADIYFFGINNKHLDWEFAAYFQDLPVLLAGLWDDSILLFLFYILLPFAWIIPGYRYFIQKRAGSTRQPSSRVSPEKSRTGDWLAIFLAYAILIPAITIAGRGGIQSSPLRAANAMHYRSAYLNSIPLNGLITIAYAMQDSHEYEIYFPVDENIQFVQNILGNKNDFKYPAYPLLRYMPRTNVQSVPERPNLVLVILESYTARYLEAHGGNPAIAPHLNAMIKQGLYFDRFIASGGRSANGLFCMLAGMPDRAGRTVFRSSYIHNRYGGLASLLKAKGYSTHFLHGGDLSFDNLDSALPHLGFDHNIGYDELKADGSYHLETPWGFDDADTFKKLSVVMENARQPFLAAVFSVNTHHPYIIPDKKFNRFGPEVDQYKFLNSFHYTDHVVGQFMQAARSKKYYKNTIFIFVADHAHHHGLNYLEDRHIPFLIFAPGMIQAGHDSRIASQIDILPTLLALSGGNSLYSAMGFNLLQKKRNRNFAYYAGGSGTNLIGWIEHKNLLVHSIDINQSFLLKGTHPASQIDLSAQNPVLKKQFLKNALHFHQFARTLEKNNRAWPSDAELKKFNRAVAKPE